jgi:hypothetical protein
VEKREKRLLPSPKKREKRLHNSSKERRDFFSKEETILQERRDFTTRP